MYRVPEEHYYRIHHCRPRFKGDIENVLIFMATEVSKLNEMNRREFKDRMNEAVKRFPGNMVKSDKTINNWRTEISALFGFIQHDNDRKMSKPGQRAIDLAENQDLVQSFKVFLQFFQYPGGHIKAHEVVSCIEHGINFKPAQFILKLLKFAEETEGIRIGITKSELTHCVFNDLRCTTGNEDISDTWHRIKTNRINKVEYDWEGDIIRYAGDILDYMVIANLITTHGNNLYYINWLERSAVETFLNTDVWFNKYDRMISQRTADIKDVRKIEEQWFDHVNQKIDDNYFKTDLLALISSDEKEYEELNRLAHESLEKRSEQSDLSTKEIGDWGEGLVHAHECAKLKTVGREDLVHLVKLIPSQFAVGYDIQSVEPDTTKRYIEVKSTISSKPTNFSKFHLTPNEWSTADTLKDRYFIYRLFISKHEKKLLVIQNPVGLYKNDLIQMTPRNGADIVFDQSNIGEFEELLTWKD